MPIPDGVFAAAVTPRRLGVQDINLGVMWDLIDFLCDRKVDGIVLLGSTGEFVHYSNSERMRMMGLAPKRSRVPILINVSHSTLDGAVELAQASAASGAAGVLVMPPYFFRYTDDGVRTFLLRFVEESDIDIPILLYNIPQFGNRISQHVAFDLIRQGVVHGIKDSGGEWDYLSDLQQLRSHTPFMLMVGSDALYSRAYCAGVNGVISGVACAIPELLVALNRALNSGSQASAENLSRRLHEFLSWLDSFPVPAGVREAACLRGLKLGPNAAPYSKDQGSRLAEFREWFKPWLNTVLSECRHA